jgi:hypothetical protein
VLQKAESEHRAALKPGFQHRQVGLQPSANTAEHDYYPQSDGMSHLAPHGGVQLAIMNVPAFLALIKF